MSSLCEKATQPLCNHKFKMHDILIQTKKKIKITVSYMQSLYTICTIGTTTFTSILTKMHMWYSKMEVNLWKLCCHSHQRCDRYISTCPLLRAVNQSNLHAIKAKRGCDYYSTKCDAVRVPFFSSFASLLFFFLQLVIDECFMAPPAPSTRAIR